MPGLLSPQVPSLIIFLWFFLIFLNNTLFVYIFSNKFFVYILIRLCLFLNDIECI